MIVLVNSVKIFAIFPRSLKQMKTKQHESIVRTESLVLIINFSGIEI